MTTAVLDYYEDAQTASAWIWCPSCGSDSPEMVGITAELGDGGPYVESIDWRCQRCGRMFASTGNEVKHGNE